MAIQGKNGYSHETIRVYAPSRGNLALAPEAAPRTRVAAEPVKKPRRSPAPKQAVPEAKVRRRTLAETMRAYKVLPKFAAVLCVGIATSAMLFVIMRYSRISSAYNEVNELSSQIENMEKAVEKANVDYLFSIDIDAAHDAARAAGMVYPTVDNISD